MNVSTLVQIYWKMHDDHDLVCYALHTQTYIYIYPYNIRLKGTLMLQKTKCRFI